MDPFPPVARALGLRPTGPVLRWAAVTVPTERLTECVGCPDVCETWDHFRGPHFLGVCGCWREKVPAAGTHTGTFLGEHGPMARPLPERSESMSWYTFCALRLPLIFIQAAFTPNLKCDTHNAALPGPEETDLCGSGTHTPGPQLGHGLLALYLGGSLGAFATPRAVDTAQGTIANRK